MRTKKPRERLTTHELNSIWGGINAPDLRTSVTPMPFSQSHESDFPPTSAKAPKPPLSIDAFESAMRPSALFQSPTLPIKHDAADQTVTKTKQSKTFLSNALGVSIDTARGPELQIPNEIHRFWSGGKMSDAAMSNLRESAEKTKGSDYKHTLWYSHNLEKQLNAMGLVPENIQRERSAQREDLKRLGYQVRPIEDLASGDNESGSLSASEVEKLAQKAADELKSGGKFKYDGIKHLSDIARLMYLRDKGGFHFDVDMGLGNMDFSRSYFHNDESGRIPLLGAVTALSDDKIATHLKRTSPLNLNLSDSATRESAEKVARRAQEMTGMLNGMIASRPGNDRISEAIDTLKVSPLMGLDFESGMTANPFLLYGGLENVSGLNEEERDRLTVTKEKYKALAVPVYLFALQHLTDDSDSR